jgi:hypothetical protein
MLIIGILSCFFWQLYGWLATQPAECLQYTSSLQYFTVKRWSANMYQYMHHPMREEKTTCSECILEYKYSYCVFGHYPSSCFYLHCTTFQRPDSVSVIRCTRLLPFPFQGTTAQGELWFPEQSPSVLLCSSSFLRILSFSFYWWSSSLPCHIYFTS